MDKAKVTQKEKKWKLSLEEWKYMTLDLIRKTARYFNTEQYRILQEFVETVQETDLQ